MRPCTNLQRMVARGLAASNQMNGFGVMLQYVCVCVCLLPCFCTFIFLLCSRCNFLSWSAQGRPGVEPGPSIQSHSEKRLGFYSAGGCRLWHFLHSPTVCLTLLCAVCEYASVCVCCKTGIFFFCLFCAWSSQTLQPWGFNSAAQPLPARPLFRTPQLPLTEHCVPHGRAFCLQGLLTHPRDHLE